MNKGTVSRDLLDANESASDAVMDRKVPYRVSSEDLQAKKREASDVTARVSRSSARALLPRYP